MTWRNDVAVRRTFAYYVLFMCRGLSIAVIGPTLPALAEQTHTSLSQMGWLFLADSIGGILGTVMLGRLLDRVCGHMLLRMAGVTTGAMLALTPVTPWFWLLLVIVGFKGIADGIIYTGTNTLLVWTYREKSSSYMCGMHFCFGLGALGAPLLAAQFIDKPGGHQWVYWILAACAATAGLRSFRALEAPRPAPVHRTRTSIRGGTRTDLALVVPAALFLFFYVGAEVTFGGWLYTYAVSLDLSSAVEAAYLTSGFWLALTLGRLLSIPLASRFTPCQIIVAALLTDVSLLSIVMLTVPASEVALWVMTLGLGLCMAPLWTMGYTFASQSGSLSAQGSVIVLLGGSVGRMILPSLAGPVMDAGGPQTLLYLVGGSLFAVLLAFMAMLSSCVASVGIGEPGHRG